MFSFGGYSTPEEQRKAEEAALLAADAPLMYEELESKDLEDLSFVQQRDLQRFREMGFRPFDALKLAVAGAPTARVERALFDGCSLEQALDIWT